MASLIARHRRFGSIALLCGTVVAAVLIAIASSPSGAADESKKPARSHAHAAGDGVSSMDVISEGGRTHLLTVRREREDKPPILEYRRSEDGGEKWSTPQVIARDDLPPPIGAHRGMDVQLAAAGDRVVAAWTIYSSETRFGRGKIATALSGDGGKTWRAGVNPADDGSEGDHAFLDLAADERGTFHAVWLDSRSGKKGLIYTNSSDGGASWSRNTVLDAESCECCWNTITAAGSKVLVLYRDKNPRDMAMICSDDSGMTWGKAVVVGDFKWQFDGCPHVGGGLNISPTNSQVFATVWTGKPDVLGSYALSSPDGGRTWNAPVRLGQAKAMRSDVASAGGKTVDLWDEMTDGTGAIFAATSSDHGKTWSPPARLSAVNVSATYPRILATHDGFRAFWTEAAEGQPDVWRSRKL